jgi:hypothetical protein
MQRQGLRFWALKSVSFGHCECKRQNNADKMVEVHTTSHLLWMQLRFMEYSSEVDSDAFSNGKHSLRSHTTFKAGALKVTRTTLTRQELQRNQ